MEAKHTLSVALPKTGLRAVILINGSFWGGVVRLEGKGQSWGVGPFRVQHWAGSRERGLPVPLGQMLRGEAGGTWRGRAERGSWGSGILGQNCVSVPGKAEGSLAGFPFCLVSPPV